MKGRSLRLPALAIILALAGCKESTGLGEARVHVSALAGDVQFGLPNTTLTEPLQVMVTNAVDEKPVSGLRVEWRVVSGDGTLTAPSSTTDSRGIASTQLRLGGQLGESAVEATTARIVGQRPRFSAQAVQQPQITSVNPASVNAGDTVTVSGTNFNPIADYNNVTFDGVRGLVVSATAGQLRVVVPACVPTRTVGLRVSLGAVQSAAFAIPATGLPGGELQLEPGEAQVSVAAAELACLRLPGAVPNARYLVVAQNTATAFAAGMAFELTTLAGTSPVASVAALAGTLAADQAWELGLRRREAGFLDARIPSPAATAQLVDPQVGDRRTFRVLTADYQTSVNVTAEVRVVSQRAVLYVDLAAPAGGFTTPQLQSFAQRFDDPIYATNVSVFGPVTDIDSNGRVIILLTPRVNALTPRGEGSYIAGYFYGCDLVARSRCSDTNSGEIFYSLVPDPLGQFSDARGAAELLRSIPPVLAHEFQHMINFGQRNQTLDALWLSEGLAHMAEDVVGEVFAQRGDAPTARDFRRPNYLRAHRWLSQVSGTSMIADDEQGTIELRGAAWLFLRYLRGQYGGNQLLTRLTQTTLSSTQNVTTQTGQSWSRLLSDFVLALYADEAPELVGVTVPARYTFTDFNPRTAITEEAGSFPLQLTTRTLGDAAVSGKLPSSSSAFVLLTAPAGSYGTVNMIFSGARGGPFTSGVPQLSILRLR